MNAASLVRPAGPSSGAPRAADDRRLVLVCDAQGRLRRVLCDDFRLTAALPPGDRVARLVDADAQPKFDAFTAECARAWAAVDWQIAVPQRGRLGVLHFAGLRLGHDELLVVASARRGATLPPPAAPQPASAAAQRAAEDAALYDELMGVNNELTNVQRQLAKSHRELQRLNAEKNRWLGIAAHDLRSPLSIVQMYAEFLQAEAGAALGAEARGFLGTIRESVGFMQRLVDDLLDVAQIEAGGVQLQRQPADLADLLARSVALNRVPAARKGIAVEYRAEAAAWLPLDAAKIEQALNNLIGNAVKFSPPGSTIEVGLRQDGDAWCVSIADQGPGIAADAQARLFQPFVTAGSRATAGEKSTGLGLAIVRRVVEAHGGRIGVRSAPGRGAVFHFSLPLAEAAGERP